MTVFDIMAAPFAECLVLVAIHTYLGIHVLKRRVIFVDLALAQIAALGTVAGFVFGIMPDTLSALIYSVLFTSIGAAAFSLTRFRRERVPHEAIIGLIYAVASACTILVIDKSGSSEHLKDILVGHLLWVTWPQVFLAAGVYLGVGVIHVVFRHRLAQISDDPEGAFAAGVRVRLWDFLFYFTFGLVIALSTRVAGVLLVFVFLVAPAILALAVTRDFGRQLLVGWTTGTAVTIAGLLLSWKADLPSGPAIIVVYGVVLILAGLVAHVVRAPNRSRAFRTVSLGLLAAALALAGVFGAGIWLGNGAIERNARAQSDHHGEARHNGKPQGTEGEQTHDQHDQTSEASNSCHPPDLVRRFHNDLDLEAWFAQISALSDVDPGHALQLLAVALADPETPLLYREEGVELLERLTGSTFGFDALQGMTQNAQALDSICRHLQTNQP